MVIRSEKTQSIHDFCEFFYYLNFQNRDKEYMLNGEEATTGKLNFVLSDPLHNVQRNCDMVVRNIMNLYRKIKRS